MSKKEPWKGIQTAPSDFRKLLRAAERRGFQVTLTGKNHIKVLAPNGVDIYVLSLTPRTGRGILDFKAWLKRVERERR